MANIEISEKPDFVTEIQKLEPTTPAHADVFNEINKRLLENEKYLKENKVDKIEGKGLSSNDFTNAFKEKVESDRVEYANSAGNAKTVNGHYVNRDVPENAQFTDTIYTHPATHPPYILSNGDLPIGVTATNGTDYGTSRIRNIHAGTGSPYGGGNGSIYLQYE